MPVLCFPFIRPAPSFVSTQIRLTHPSPSSKPPSLAWGSKISQTHDTIPPPEPSGRLLLAHARLDALVAKCHHEQRLRVEETSSGLGAVLVGPDQRLAATVFGQLPARQLDRARPAPVRDVVVVLRRVVVEDGAAHNYPASGCLGAVVATIAGADNVLPIALAHGLMMWKSERGKGG